ITGDFGFLDPGALPAFMDLDPDHPGAARIETISGLGSYIVKIDAAGHFVWGGGLASTTLPSPFDFHYESVIGWGIGVDGSQNVYVTGTFSATGQGHHATVDFDPGPGEFRVTSQGGNGHNDAFVMKLDAAGHLAWVRDFGSPD